MADPNNPDLRDLDLPEMETITVVIGEPKPVSTVIGRDPVTSTVGGVGPSGWHELQRNINQLIKELNMEQTVNRELEEIIREKPALREVNNRLSLLDRKVTKIAELLYHIGGRIAAQPTDSTTQPEKET